MVRSEDTLRFVWLSDIVLDPSLVNIRGAVTCWGTMISGNSLSEIFTVAILASCARDGVIIPDLILTAHAVPLRNVWRLIGKDKRDSESLQDTLPKSIAPQD